ncbi:uncharacterized protein LOC116300475 [Actinia tenebrosa]|uniref:Uncharacterized protein LOC116300475 n=1 Tax=Actinia tenebrosa TaxID=6105 RepID=A0A6P8ICD3_ACTTE|nr:uncharacterized protein LOC116300475 [Actinia tenebrosa]
MTTEDSLVINLNIFCTNQNKKEQTKLAINKDEVSSVYQLKTKIQDLCKAPICDQKLSYLDQPLSDPTTKLSELYLRDGDTICVEFLEKVDLEEFNECIRKLKGFLSSAPPCSSDGNYIHVPLIKNVGKMEDLYADIAEPLESLDMKFSLWKTVQVKANRHYFVQEGGLKVLVEVLHYSQKRYSWICSTTNPQVQTAILVEKTKGSDSSDDDDEDYEDDIAYRSDELVQSFNEWQMILCSLVLQTLWNFMETGPDTWLVLNMDTLQSMIDSYIMSDNYSGPSPHLAVHLRESALGCLCGCVEYDEKAQFQVADNLAMMKKLSHTIEPKGFFQRNECPLAANTIFYVSFNQQAIEKLISSGFYEEILDKVQAWHQEFDSSILVLVTWYYCLLFLARVRSSTLCTIPHKHSNAIDSVIERFVQEYNPRRIAEYEENKMYVWMTLAPIIHMAFAAGLPRTRKNTRQLKTDTNEGSLSAKKSRYSVEKTLPEEIDMNKFAENDLSTASISDLHMDTDNNAPQLYRQFTGAKEIELGNPKTARWPGSSASQKLAIFALQHTLFSRDNRQLLKAEGLDSYLVCLRWQLKSGTEYDKLTNELLVVRGDEIKVPTLTVICKSVLASMHGLDSVFRV